MMDFLLVCIEYIHFIFSLLHFMLILFDPCHYQIIFKMVEENPRDVGHDMDGLSIVYGDESLSRLYENSRNSSDQLPAQSGIMFPTF